MSNNDWVQQGTPRDEEWTAEEDDYGVPVAPAEWDDYASEQTVPVPPAPTQPEADAADAGEAPPAQEGDAVDLPEEAAPADAPPHRDEPEPSEDEAHGEPEPLRSAEPGHGRDPEEGEGPDATYAVPVAAAGAATGAATAAGLYRRDRDPEQTQVIDGAQHQRLADELAEEQRLAEQLRAEREARAQRLGMVATSDANAVRDAAPARRRGVGHFGSFGLFVLRLVAAAILGVVGYQILSDIDATAEFLSRTLLPEPRIVAWSVGFGLAAMAVLLIIGLVVRIVGLLLAVVAGCSLAFIQWGQFSPFMDGRESFLGDRDLLLLAVGLVFLSLGGGRWGIDGAVVKARENAREAHH